jgi:hypothetical protein
MSAPATEDSHKSAMSSQVISSPAQPPALPKADENLPLTFALALDETRGVVLRGDLCLTTEETGLLLSHRLQLPTSAFVGRSPFDSDEVGRSRCESEDDESTDRGNMTGATPSESPFAGDSPLRPETCAPA